MRMKQSESLHLKKLKMKMLNTIPEVLKLPNLQERDRLILADILADMADERTPYKKRLAAFTIRQYVIDEIRQKYSQQYYSQQSIVGPLNGAIPYSLPIWDEEAF